MTDFNYDFIYGASVGFGIADNEVCEEQGLQWAFHIDLLILRLMFFKVKE